MNDAGQLDQLMARMTGFRNAGRLSEAIAVYQEIARIAPNAAAAYANLSTLLMESGDADAAARAAQQAIAANPAFHGAHVALAAALEESGEIAQAIVEFDRAIELAPNQPKIRSSKIYAMEFLPGISPADLLSEQRHWDRIYASKTPLVAKRSIQNRKIRLGYLSAFFYHHAEAFFVLPLLRHHDRTKFEVHCYSDVAGADDITAQHRAAVDFWHECRSLSNDQLSQKIRGDEIDILVDLMMHMGRNRAPVLAQKPAPIQIDWLAYPGGTGIESIDYRITDPIIDPSAGDDSYTEKSLRLPDCWCCYDPLSRISPAAPRPNRPIVFGSLNNPRKLNEPTISLWARAMHTTPDSKMIILSISARQRASILAAFELSGIAPNRIEFVGRTRRTDYLRQYDRIDIALDSLPYNGITTTCDALWMGAPVVTLAGQTAAGRVGTSLLTAAGFPELATTSADKFVEVAERLASDPQKLEHLRLTLRHGCEHSTLMNHPAFAKNFESALIETCA